MEAVAAVCTILINFRNSFPDQPLQILVPRVILQLVGISFRVKRHPPPPGVQQ